MLLNDLPSTLLKGLYHRRVFSRFVYKLTRNPMNGVVSEISRPEMKSIAGNDNRSVKQIVLFFKRKEASVTLFAFVVLISQFLENDMFSIEMDPCMLFRLSGVLKKY